MRSLLFFFLLISLSSPAQLKSYILSVKGDTLNRVDMKGLKQGPWVVHIDNLRGERGYEEEGYYENGAKEGTWKRYSLEGIKIAEENYRWGKLNGRSKYFTYNGGLLREESWRAIDPAIAYDTVPVYDLHDPTKIRERAVVKNEGVSLKHGEWTYYDPAEGTIVKTEKYQLGKLLTDDGNTVDDELKPIGFGNTKAPGDTTGKKLTKPQVILDYEKKNSGKKKVRTRDGSTGGY